MLSHEKSRKLFPFFIFSEWLCVRLEVLIESLIELSGKVIYVWSFLTGAVLNYRFYFFQSNRTIAVFYFFWYQFWWVVFFKQLLDFISICMILIVLRSPWLSFFISVGSLVEFLHGDTVVLWDQLTLRSEVLSCTSQDISSTMDSPLAFLVAQW